MKAKQNLVFAGTALLLISLVALAGLALMAMTAQAKAQGVTLPASIRFVKSPPVSIGMGTQTLQAYTDRVTGVTCYVIFNGSGYTDNSPSCVKN